MIAFRREVLEALLASPKWRSKLERAKTDDEAAKIILAFAEEKGFVVERVNEEPQVSNRSIETNPHQ